MPSINLNEIITKGAGTLEKKFMGGVTQESAQRAIQETAQEVQKQMDEIARAGIDEVKSSNAKAMADLKENHLRELAEKDRENLSLKKSGEALSQEKNVLDNKLGKLMARIKKGLTFREIDTLADGSKIYEKHNLNGAKAVKTVNKDDKTTQVNIELADKTFRRTSYNPQTNKPTRTVTNATPTGETIEIIYNQYGQSLKPKVLNVKKSKEIVKPTMISRKTNVVCENMVEVETFYSDGSKIKAEVDKKTNEILNWTKWENPNGWWSEWYAKDPQTGIETKVKCIEGTNGKRGYEKRVVSSPNGIVRTIPYSRHEDELTGLITNVDRITFPKSSPVKRIEQYHPEGYSTKLKEVVKMKNGTVYEMTDYKEVPSNRSLRPGGGLDVLAPQNVVKIERDGTKTEMKHEEIMPWLETFHPDFNFKLMEK